MGKPLIVFLLSIMADQFLILISSSVYTLCRPVARNFNQVVLLYKIVDLFNKIGVFKQIVNLSDKFVAFSNKIVDLFGKIVDLLFERGGGVLLHLENPPGYGPAVLYICNLKVQDIKITDILIKPVVLFFCLYKHNQICISCIYGDI